MILKWSLNLDLSQVSRWIPKCFHHVTLAPDVCSQLRLRLRQPNPTKERRAQGSVRRTRRRHARHR